MLLKIAIFTLLLETFSWSAGTPGALWLRWGLGGRAIGLGEAVVGLVDDSSATYWNPANLSLLSREDIIFMLMSSSLAKDVGYGYQFISYARPVSEKLSLGGNLFFHLEFQPAVYYDAVNDTGVKFGDFFYLTAVNTFSGSYKLSPRFSLGANFKILETAWAIAGPKDLSDKLPEIRDGQSLSWAVDFGALYQTPLQPVVVGLAVKNIGPDYVMINKSQADSLPHTVHLGILWKIIDNPRNKLFLTIDPYFIYSSSTTHHKWEPYTGNADEEIYPNLHRFKGISARDKAVADYVKRRTSRKEINGREIISHAGQRIVKVKLDEKGQVGIYDLENCRIPNTRPKKKEDRGVEDRVSWEEIEEALKKMPEREYATLMDKDGNLGKIYVLKNGKVDGDHPVQDPGFDIMNTYGYLVGWKEATFDPIYGVNIGLEYQFANLVFFRVGTTTKHWDNEEVDSISDFLGHLKRLPEGIGIGIGLKYKNYVVDYACVPWGVTGRRTHVISFRIFFGASRGYR
jgi:hypothetical protein